MFANANANANANVGVNDRNHSGKTGGPQLNDARNFESTLTETQQACVKGTANVIEDWLGVVGFNSVPLAAVLLGVNIFSPHVLPVVGLGAVGGALLGRNGGQRLGESIGHLICK